MSSQNIFFTGFTALLLLLGSCSVKDIEPSSIEAIGREFYPVQSGNTWIYQVDSTTYTSRFIESQNRIITDTFRDRFFIMEKIADSIGLQEGNPFFRIEIYRSEDSLGPWRIDSVWSIQRGRDKILKTENNRPIVKLKFPLQKGVRWDGNQYNSLQESSGTGWFYVKEINTNYPFGNNLYSSALIIQKSDSDCLGKTSFYERYLKGIGPAFMMKSSILYLQEGPDPCGNLPRIESGTERIFKLIRFEKGN